MLDAGDLRVEPLDGKKHDRESFTCGVESLDVYLKTQASQDARRKANAVLVLLAADDPRAVLGYVTLCAHALAPGMVPEEARKHLPRYPLVSATLIGRLAIAKSVQGKGLGAALLVRALRKAYENADVVGSSMVVVDALDEGAARFYAAHGIVRLPESMRLLMPMQTIGRLLAVGPGVSKSAR
jgi:GNAT superfamily N-acetyltransferase